MKYFPFHGSDVFDKAVERFKFNGKRPFGRRGDALFELRKLKGGESRGIGNGLAVDELALEFFIAQCCRIRRGHFDEIADHVVVADLQVLDADGFGVTQPASRR